MKGPSWLTFDREQWQVPPQLCSAVVEEAKQVALASHEAPESYMSTVFQRFSKWWRLLRTFAYVYRFVHNSRHPSNKLKGPISIKELKEATNKIVMLLQKEEFSKEFQILTSDVDRNDCKFTVNQIKYLNIFKDENDCLRVVEHERLLHAGIETTLSNLRSRFQGQPLTQIMADLPKYRVTPARPFLLSGVDFAGPLEVKEWRSRKPMIHKG
ncbi:uncharacterized protein [Choristoneura fumiferana]|uniref:uncharacterized protein n=1 Tax=Choristoneura fumiferana TaxID=7141 RepID=UPI003D1584D2